MHFRSGGSDPGRDGCRVPLPWRGDGASFGFSPPGATASPWLPQPAWWGAHAADAQDGVPGSMLSLYREALRIRRCRAARSATARCAGSTRRTASSPSRAASGSPAS